MAVSLEQFLQMRENAQTRSVSSYPSVNSQNAKVPAWKQVLDAKRNELYGQEVQQSSANTQIQSTTQVKPVKIPDGSLNAQQSKSLTEQLQMQQQQGYAVRSVGNLIDMRA